MSDRRERLNDPTVALNVALQGLQSGIWTAMPAKVVSVAKVDGQNTVNVQPTIMGAYRAPTAQEFTNYKMPQLLDCPLLFLGAGAFVLTFPVAVGDEGLVIFASRCIDAWFATGSDDNVQAEFRMHDLSDGFFIPGFRSVPHKITSPSTSAVELRSLDHTSYVSIDGSGNVKAIAAGDVDITAANNVNITAPQSTINGNTKIVGDLLVTGTIVSQTSVTAPLVSGTTDVEFGPSHKSMSTHVHAVEGIDTGSHTVTSDGPT